MMKKPVIDFQKVSILFRLGRLPNLFIIAGTQVLLRYCILGPFVYSEDTEAISPIWDFTALVVVTLLLTIAGYVINDYFDRKVDAVNRPDKQVMDRLISAHGAIKLHMTLNIIAILLGFWLAWRIESLTFGLIFPFITGLLWLYSAKYKRTLLWGNLIVSFLSAFVVLIVWLFEFFWLRLQPEVFAMVLPDLYWVSKVFMAYALFAFLITMISEIIKDLEDVEGDKAFGVITLPVAAGQKTARLIAAGIIIVAIILLVYSQVILERLNFRMVILYFFLAVQLPALYLLLQLFRAKKKQDYRNLATLCKIIMVAGLLSLELLYISI